MQTILANAKRASRDLAVLDTDIKNSALIAIAKALTDNADEILQANKIDVENAKGKISDVMIDRLSLNQKRIEGMAQGIMDVVKLPDPVGEEIEAFARPNGLQISRVSVPLGVIAIIYESRPNVTSDGAALCLKSGNACILRCGKEAFNTSKSIVNVIRATLEKQGLNPDFVNMPSSPSREDATALMNAVGYVDALIPRGGAGLIRACVENAKVPCIETGTGICHVYVDRYADFDKALNIIENAKTSRPSVCNAEEVCLVHENIAKEFLPLLKQRLVSDRKENPVQLRLCEKSAKIIDGIMATEADFNTEFLDYILAVKIVSSADEAIEHIANHSTHHSDCIITENSIVAKRFIKNVDSAAVYHNASTRFTDGGEFGKGCEIGISTQKLHARGPMGLKELTSYKYVISGEGQIR
ncbi:MAG: glutamate-5-semialdehyde dehydrogenase [Clostridia bacterium]|nr:glutamate-5-semialdehyde dehydrogenase [Clostridia bacterium]